MRELKHLKKKYGEPADLEQLFEWVMTVMNTGLPEGVRIAGFSWNIVYSECVSNTHYCPVSGYTNFRQSRFDESGKPLAIGYPGFKGRVWIRYNKKFSESGATIVKKSFTYPGTGGIGSYDGPWDYTANIYYSNKEKLRLHYEFTQPQLYGYNYRFFLSDFPLIEQKISKEKFMHHLKHGDVLFRPPRLISEYTDDATKAHDDSLLSWYRGVHLQKIMNNLCFISD